MEVHGAATTHRMDTGSSTTTSTPMQPSAPMTPTMTLTFGNVEFCLVPDEQASSSPNSMNTNTLATVSPLGGTTTPEATIASTERSSWALPPMNGNRTNTNTTTVSMTFLPNQNDLQLYLKAFTGTLLVRRCIAASMTSWATDALGTTTTATTPTPINTETTPPAQDHATSSTSTASRLESSIAPSHEHFHDQLHQQQGLDRNHHHHDENNDAGQILVSQPLLMPLQHHHHAVTKPLAAVTTTTTAATPQATNSTNNYKKYFNNNNNMTNAHDQETSDDESSATSSRNADDHHGREHGSNEQDNDEFAHHNVVVEPTLLSNLQRHHPHRQPTTTTHDEFTSLSSELSMVPHDSGLLGQPDLSQTQMTNSSVVEDDYDDADNKSNYHNKQDVDFHVYHNDQTIMSDASTCNNASDRTVVATMSLRDALPITNHPEMTNARSSEKNKSSNKNRWNDDDVDTGTTTSPPRKIARRWSATSSTPLSLPLALQEATPAVWKPLTASAERQPTMKPPPPDSAGKFSSECSYIGSNAFFLLPDSDNPMQQDPSGNAGVNDKSDYNTDDSVGSPVAPLKSTTAKTTSSRGMVTNMPQETNQESSTVVAASHDNTATVANKCIADTTMTTSIVVSPRVSMGDRGLASPSASSSTSSSSMPLAMPHKDHRSTTTSAEVIIMNKHQCPTPPARWGHTLTPLGDHRFLLYGGQTIDPETRRPITLDDVYIYDAKQQQWIQPKVQATDPRQWHTATYLPSRNLLLSFGGEAVKLPAASNNRRGGGNNRGNRKAATSNQLRVLDTEIMVWYPPEVSGDIPSGRSGHTATLLQPITERPTSGTSMQDSFFVVFGGVKGANSKWLNAVSVLDTTSWHWHTPRIQGTAPPPRSYHSATAVAGHRLVLFGGNDATRSFNSVHVLEMCHYDDDGNMDDDQGMHYSWQWKHPQVRGIPPASRTGHSATLLPDGKTICIYGGWDPNADDDDDDDGADKANFDSQESRLLDDSDLIFDDIFYLDTETWTWTRAGSMSATPPVQQQQQDATSMIRRVNGKRVGHAAVWIQPPTLSSREENGAALSSNTNSGQLCVFGGRIPGDTFVDDWMRWGGSLSTTVQTEALTDTS